MKAAPVELLRLESVAYTLTAAHFLDGADTRHGEAIEERDRDQLLDGDEPCSRVAGRRGPIHPKRVAEHHVSDAPLRLLHRASAERPPESPHAIVGEG